MNYLNKDLYIIFMFTVKVLVFKINKIKEEEREWRLNKSNW